MSITHETLVEMIKRQLKEEKANKLLTESSLNRVRSHIMKHDSATITAFRDDPSDSKYCMDASAVSDKIESNKQNKKKIYRKTNRERNSELKGILMGLNYGITPVKGVYVENYKDPNAPKTPPKIGTDGKPIKEPKPVEVGEESFFVLNSPDDPNFIQNMYALSKKFCQDCVLIIPKGGKGAYVYGTNKNWPGYKVKNVQGDIYFGEEGEFMTKVKNRPFKTKKNEPLKELFTKKDSNARTKAIVSKMARDFLQEMKNFL